MKATNIEYEDAPSGNITFYNYKSPLMKFEGYDGSEGFGFVGALIFDGSSDQVQCHLCGKWFEQLGHHLNREHAMTAGKYKEIVGLNKSTALMGEKMRAKLIASGLDKRMKNLQNRTGKKHTALVRKRIQETLKQNRAEQKNLRNTCPEQLLERFVKLVQEKGYVPSVKEIPFYGTLINTYGSMQRVGELTGIKCRKPGQTRPGERSKLPRQKIIEEVRKFYDEHGRIPKGKDLPADIRKRMWRIGLRGIIKDALSMDGRYRKPDRIIRYSKDELLDFLRNFEKINGRRPSYSDCKRGLLPNLGRYSYNFGSWKKALNLAFTK